MGGSISNPTLPEVGLPDIEALETALAAHAADETAIHGIVAASGLVTEQDERTGLFACYRNGAVNIPANSAPLEVLFENEDFDVDGWYNPATGRYTPQVPGWYDLSALISATLASLRAIFIGIAKNGTIVKHGNLGWNASGSNSTGASSARSLVKANGSTDFFSIHAMQTNTSVAAMLTGTFSHFAGRLVARDP